ncbi:MAG: response regulator [Euryarchaeota archaeon]|nr:response regulator [Euryarchaeota archaeon]
METSPAATLPLVLVVDDNPDDLTTFARAVRGLPLRVEEATSGREGLQKALNGNHALLVLDYNLGDMTGTEILLRLKEAGSTVPVLIQSGIGSHFVVARALALGAEDFIAKDSPEYFQEVQRKIQSALSRQARAPRQDVAGDRRQPVAELEKAIDDLIERTRGAFSAVGFSSPDGFRVTTRIRQPGALTPETICAMVASATSSSRFLGQGLGTRDLKLVTAEFADGVLLCAPVGDYGFLFAVSPTVGPSAAPARREFDLAVPELANLLESITKIQRFSR